jgi:hypothetical protein
MTAIAGEVDVTFAVPSRKQNWEGHDFSRADRGPARNVRLLPLRYGVNHSRLSRRPLQRTSANQVDVQVEDGLSRPGPDVQHSPVAVLDPSFVSDARGRQMAAAHQFGVFGRRFLQSGKMSFRDNQNVRGALRIQIFKGEGVLIFVDFLGWHLTANDATK